VRYCGLDRSGLTPTTATTVETMAEVATTGEAARPGTVRLTDTSIVNPIVDTTRYGYPLQCHLAYDESISGSLAPGIHAADITFTISSTNG
jgi:hypothetical protein